MEELRFMNAAGMCKTLEDVDAFCRAPITELTLGSVTAKPREGNSGTTFYIDDETGASLNALGLPNRGLDWYCEQMPGIADQVHAAGKRLRVSIAGFSIEDYVSMASRLGQFDVDLIEVNLSCPNVWDGGDQKPVFALDAALTETICQEVIAVVPERVSLAVKLSPCDPVLIKRLAEIVTGAGRIEEVVCVNTLPNGFIYDDHGNQAMGGNGLAGLGGKPLKPVSIGHVKQFRSLLPDRIAIIGVGGVFSGKDVTDYFAAGAAGVQVGTASYAYGVGVFQDIIAEFFAVAA